MFGEKWYFRNSSPFHPGENRLTVQLPANLPAGQYYLRMGKQHRAFVKK
jgi:hypothetical protein